MGPLGLFEALDFLSGLCLRRQCELAVRFSDGLVFSDTGCLPSRPSYSCLPACNSLNADRLRPQAIYCFSPRSGPVLASKRTGIYGAWISRVRTASEEECGLM